MIFEFLTAIVVVGVYFMAVFVALGYLGLALAVIGTIEIMNRINKRGTN